MKVSYYILDALRQEGVDHVFLVPGSLINPLLHALPGIPNLRAVVAAHEAGAAFMADGYARASGRFGVCLTIGGPGVANMVPALAAASADGSPVLVITGEVPTDLEGQGAFQDASPAGVHALAFVRPVTAYAQQIAVSRHMPHHLQRALRAMLGAVRQPACISVPRQIQEEDVEEAYERLEECITRPPRLLDQARTAEVIEKLGRTRHVAILAGNGAVLSGASEELDKLARTYAIPVATTLQAKGVLPEDHPSSLGVFGYAGTRQAAEVLLGDEVSVLLVLGSSLNQRDTMMWSRRLQPGCAIVQVDIEPRAFGRNYPADWTVVGDVREFLRALLSDGGLGDAWTKSVDLRGGWLQSIRSIPRFYDEDTRGSDAVPMHPARVVTALRRAAPPNTVVLVDSGAHRAFAGHHWEAYGPRQYLSSTTLAPMGWAIAAAIGAKAARPDAPCLVITGDGCMLMHGMEVQTAARYGISIVFAVINNGAHGAVHLGVRDREPTQAFSRLPLHDWVSFARALGADGELVEQPADLAAACERAFEACGPYVLDLRCDPEFETPITPWTEARQEWVEGRV